MASLVCAAGENTYDKLQDPTLCAWILRYNNEFSGSPLEQLAGIINPSICKKQDLTPLASCIEGEDACAYRNVDLKSDVTMKALGTRNGVRTSAFTASPPSLAVTLSFGVRPTGRRGVSTLPSARRHVLGRGTKGRGRMWRTTGTNGPFEDQDALDFEEAQMSPFLYLQIAQ